MLKCLAILIAIVTTAVAQNQVPVQQPQGVPVQNQHQQQQIHIQQQQQVPQQQQQVPVQQQQQVPVQQQQQVPVQQQVHAQQQQVPVQQQVHAQQQQVPVQQQVHVAQQQVPVQQQVHVPQQQIIQQQQQQQQQVNMNQDHGTHRPAPGRNIIRDKNHIQDKEHMMRDLDGVIDFGTLQGEMTEDEIHFHYFKLHDTDHNNRLDGLEIFQAVSHYDTSKDAHPEMERAVLSEEEIEGLVNAVLEEDDANRDGYIDYPEFSRSLIDITA
ncbi:Multiple coagulation factor deficiency protein 2-like [Holothuria leucospilota]|uniref:Multiple coagulation factor deficiency protein 2-like n=1 Tax=Holothuria leucospilota TaxID=206669 RepID=A0A9Q1CFR8_HOLLE|nr:Multiple coagulation factor deficiency protein 2-like [Holothuria leucospilota]